MASTTYWTYFEWKEDSARVNVRIMTSSFVAILQYLLQNPHEWAMQKHWPRTHCFPSLIAVLTSNFAIFYKAVKLKQKTLYVVKARQFSLSLASMCPNKEDAHSFNVLSKWVICPGYHIPIARRVAKDQRCHKNGSFMRGCISFINNSKQIFSISIVNDVIV